MRKLMSVLAGLVWGAGVFGGVALGAEPRRSLRSLDSVDTASTVVGLGVNLAVVGRLVGAGNTLYRTAVDVTNNTGTATLVDFYFDGLSGGQEYHLAGSFSTSGALVAQGSGGSVPAKFDAHFDDFVSSLVQANLGLPSSVETNGILGSLMVVFANFTKSGQGSATARFYFYPSPNASGPQGLATIGVSLQGHEITGTEPTKLIALCRNTIGQAGVPQVRTNLFINNTGLTPSTTGVASAVNVVLSAVDAKTHAAVGTSLSFTLNPGLTQGIDVFTQLNIPSSTDRALVTVTATPSGGSGAAIEGIVGIVDNSTLDTSASDVPRADF